MRTHNAANIVVERTYRASVDDLWSLWTTKEGFESWWGPQGFRADVAQFEAREGGVLRYDMVADTPEMVAEMKKMGRPASHPAQARFTELTPKTRLIITNVIDFLPGVAPYESTITVELLPRGDEVNMVVTFSPMHAEEFSQMQKEGFTDQLTKLDRRFAG